MQRTTRKRRVGTLLVVGVGGVGVSTDEVLNLVHKTLLVGAGSLQVVIVDTGGGVLSAGKTGSVVVLVSRVGSVTLGEVVAVSGQAGQLVVVRPLVANGVTVVGTRAGKLVGVGDVLVVSSRRVEPVGTGSPTGKNSVIVGSLVVTDAHVAGGTSPLVKVSGRGVGTVGGRVGTSSDTSAGVTSGDASLNAGTLADGVVVSVVLVSGDGVLDLVGQLSVILGNVSAGTERSRAGLDTAGGVSSLAASQVTSSETRTGVSALTDEVVISGTRSDVSVVTGVVYQGVVPSVSSRVVLVVTGASIVVVTSETRTGRTEVGTGGVVVVTLVSDAGRTDVLETRSTGNAGGLAVVKVTSDGLGRGTRSGEVGSGVLEGLSASGVVQSTTAESV